MLNAFEAQAERKRAAREAAVREAEERARVAKIKAEEEKRRKDFQTQMRTALFKQYSDSKFPLSNQKYPQDLLYFLLTILNNQPSVMITRFYTLLPFSKSTNMEMELGLIKTNC